MRVLIVGAAGQLGRALSAVFAERHDVIETVYRNPQNRQAVLDLADSAGTLSVLRNMKPDVVLIAGAFCNVDLCETEQDTCWQVNVEGTHAVSVYAQEAGACAVYYSTDQVFDGTLPAHTETNRVAPLNVYAKSKAAGEAVLRESLPDRHLIMRTAWLYGPDMARKNFPLRLIDRLRAGERIFVAADQGGTPTYTEDVAMGTLYLLEEGCHGTFHATGPDRVDRYTLAQKICARFGLDPDGVIPKTTEELQQKAPRPLRVFLDCRKLNSMCGPAFRGVDAGLDALHAWQTRKMRRGSMAPC